MRRIVPTTAALLGLAALCVTGCAAGAAAPTGPPAPPPAAAAPAAPPFPDLQWLQMADAQNGWAGNRAVVLRTADGGRHWREVTPPGVARAAGRYLQAGYFPDAGHGLLLLGGNDPPTAVLSTSDGGATWTRSKLDDRPGSLIGASFADAAHGWLLLGRGAGMGKEGVDVYRTADAGGHWQLVSAVDPRTQPADHLPAGELPAGGLKTGITFCDERTGWVTGWGTHPADRPALPTFYVTHDGGESWRAGSVPPGALADADTTPTLPPLCFAGQAALLPVQFQRYDRTEMIFYASGDRGESWQPTGVLSAEQPAGPLLYSFPDPAHGRAADGRTVFVSDDGARHWTAFPLPRAYERALQIDFVSPELGWLLVFDRAPGADRTHDAVRLLRSADGGRTWQVVQPTL